MKRSPGRSVHGSEPDGVMAALAALAVEESRHDVLEGEDSALFEPLEPTRQAEILARALQQARVVPLPAVPSAPTARRNRRYFGFMGMALAAGLVLFVGLRPAGRDGTVGNTDADYDLAVSGGMAEVRGDAPKTLSLSKGSPVTLTLRPATHFEGPIEARAVFVRAGEVRPVGLEVAVSPDGAVRMTGTLGDLPFSPGPAELQVTVTRAGQPHSTVLRRPVVFVEPR